MTELNLYTTEPYNIESIASTLFVMADGKGVNVYSTKTKRIRISILHIPRVMRLHRFIRL